MSYKNITRMLLVQCLKNLRTEQNDLEILMKTIRSLEKKSFMDLEVHKNTCILIDDMHETLLFLGFKIFKEKLSPV